MTYLRARWVELLSLAAGLGLLVGMIWHIGLDSIVRDLGIIGWGLLVLVAVESLDVVLNTCGWGLAFPAGERAVSARRLLAARLAGDGVNYLTPSGTVGGEFLRVRLLGSGVPLGLRWASVGVAKVGQSVAQLVFVVLGLALVLPHLAGVSPWGAWLAAGGAAALATWGLARLVDRGAWVTLERTAGRLGLAKRIPAGWVSHGRELDAALARLGRRRLIGSLACFLLGWAVGAVEIYLILAWLGGPADWQIALAVEAGSVLIDGILFFVPGKLGTQEGGKVALFVALGLDPARGLTVGIVRRIRELIYAGLGLAALAVLSARRAPQPAPALIHRSESS